MGKLPTMREDHSEVLPYNFNGYQVFFGLERLSDHPNSRMFSHWHEDTEFIVILSGQMLYNVSGTTVSLHPGEGLFVNAKQVHFGYSKDDEDCEFLFALWHPVLLCATDSIERNFVRPVLSDDTLPFVKLTSEVLWQRKILDRLLGLKELFRKKSAPLLLQSVFFEIWYELYENAYHPAEQQSSTNNQLSTLRAMLAYIHREFSQKVYLEDIAKSGHISISSCNMIFNRYMHETPVQYLLHYRLQKGCDMLINTDSSITEIAYMAGFQSLSYFIEIFRKTYLCTPYEYRKNNEDKAALSTVLIDHAASIAP